jgi:ribosomal protein L11 methyltransferase
MNKNNTKQALIRLEADCPINNFELISYELIEMGAGAIEEGDILDSRVSFSLWTEDSILVEQIRTEFSDLTWIQTTEDIIDWDRHWKDTQHPVEVSSDLTVCPPWVEASEKQKKGILLKIEAKMAFGTGEHESTRLCAELMVGLNPTHDRDHKLLDIGTGTGILAMYAAKRCKTQIWTTEIDPVTIPCIVENFELNELPTVNGILGGLECFGENNFFDTIIANMIRSEIWPLRTDMERLLKIGGSLIISGQLLAEKYFVLEWFKESNIEATTQISQGEWWAILGTKQ